MELADDIVLGKFSDSDLDDLVRLEECAERPDHHGKDLRSFQLSFAISAVVHLALAASAFYFIAGDLQPEVDSSPSTFQVEFVALNPQLSLEEEVQVEDDREPEPSQNEAEPLETIAQEAATPSEQSSPSTEVEAIALTETDIDSDSTRIEQAQPAETIVIPSIDAVQNAISRIEQSDASRFYRYDCNRLDEENEFSNCAPQDNRDFSLATSNKVYDFYNPPAEISRSRETVNTIAAQSGVVANALALNNLPPGLSAYVLEEIEQGIETYSNSSNRAVDHMDRMIDRSAAAVMAERLFTPWVQQQSAILRSRRVENRIDSRQAESCRSYEKFVMSPAEFTQCLFLGITPFEFLLEF